MTHFPPMTVLLVSEPSKAAAVGIRSLHDAIVSKGAKAQPVDVAPRRAVVPLTKDVASNLARAMEQGEDITVVSSPGAACTPSELIQSLKDAFGSLEDAAQRLQAANVTLACDDEAPYFAPTSLSAPLSAAAATEQSSRLEAANLLTEHLGKDAVNSALTSPHAGSLFGCAVVFITLGATPLSAALADFDGSALEQHLDGSEALVVVTDLLDWRQLRESLVTSCADLAAQHLVPCLVLTGSMDVGQRELSAIGVAGAYGCLDEPLTSDGELRRLPTADEWDKAATKLARVWVRGV